jgi:hypothetical protein
VDDHLSGPEQLQQRWNLEDLRLLLPILREAQAARRVVVVTADHGHVLEDGSRQIGSAESDRWRPGSQATAPEELPLTGHRVLTPAGEHSIVALWSEGARYTGRKNGYHGGASPAEVVVPMSVLVPFGLNLPGWQPAPPQQPEWWDLPGTALPGLVTTAQAARAGKAAASRSSRRATSASETPEPQAALFATEEAPIPVAMAPSQSTQVPASNWLDDLLTCPVYRSQRQLAARVALQDDQMRRLLAALTDRGGKLGKAALAQRLGLHEMRLSGVLSVARRMLNVDQAQVLAVDETAGLVELNQDLLRIQFQLGTPATKSKGATP